MQRCSTKEGSESFRKTLTLLLTRMRCCAEVGTPCMRRCRVDGRLHHGVKGRVRQPGKRPRNYPLWEGGFAGVGVRMQSDVVAQCQCMWVCM